MKVDGGREIPSVKFDRISRGIPVKSASGTGRARPEDLRRYGSGRRMGGEGQLAWSGFRTPAPPGHRPQGRRATGLPAWRLPAGKELQGFSRRYFRNPASPSLSSSSRTASRCRRAPLSKPLKYWDVRSRSGPQSDPSTNRT